MLSAEMAAIYGEEDADPLFAGDSGREFPNTTERQGLRFQTRTACPPELKSVGGGVAENI
jgi:hypothetical protein